MLQKLCDGGDIDTFTIKKFCYLLDCQPDDIMNMCRMKGRVTNLDTKITKHVNDVIQKYASGLFRNATLAFYGIDAAPIKELINPELPTVEVSGGAADVVFLSAR